MSHGPTTNPVASYPHPLKATLQEYLTQPRAPGPRVKEFDLSDDEKEEYEMLRQERLASGKKQFGPEDLREGLEADITRDILEYRRRLGLAQEKEQDEMPAGEERGV